MDFEVNERDCKGLGGQWSTGKGQEDTGATLGL